MSQLLQLPDWLCGVIIIGGFVLIAVAGLPLFQWLTAGRLHLTEAMNNDIVFFAEAIAVFYSLTVGLIAVGVWSNYSSVSDIVSADAANIASMYRDVSGYPEPIRTDLQGQVRGYTEFIINQAWPAQMRGQSTDDGTRRLNKLAQTLAAFEPPTVGQQLLHAETLHRLNEMTELRRKRLHAAIGGGLPPVMWSVVLIGAVLTISVTYLLQIERKVQVTLTAFFAMFIGLVVFFLVYVVTIVSFLNERSQGTLERLMASPLRRGEIVVGYMLGFTVLALVQSVEVLVFSLAVLQVHNSGSVVLIFGIEALMAIAAVNLGIFLSMFARTEFQAVQFIPLVIVPQFLLSGILFSVSSEPKPLQVLSDVLPLTYAVNGLRDVMIKGADLSWASLQLDVGVVAGFIVLLVVAAVTTLRRRIA